MTDGLTAFLASQWMHILMHAFLYGMVAAGIISAWPKRNFLAALATAFWVGIFQEILQPLPAGLLPDSGALFNLLVDLAGAAAGVLVAKHLRSILSSRKTAIERKA